MNCKGIPTRWWMLLLVVFALAWAALLGRHRPRRASPVTVTDAGPAELTPAEAARVMGCRPDEVSGMLAGRPATLESVEELALEHYRWRAHVGDADSYWVTLKQAAAILGVSVPRVRQYLADDKVPYVVHRDGVRLMRREQLERAAGG